MDYSGTTDETLVTAVKKDDGKAMETLLNRYAETLDGYARRYAYLGVEKDELIQEGKIGLWKATYSFNGEGVFYPFAVRCIKSAMITAFRRFNADKNKPINESEPLSGADGVEGEADPEAEYIKAEGEKELYEKLKNLLSDTEYTVLCKYLQGYDYKSIGEQIGKTEKAVDNALQRIKAKLSPKG